MSTHIGAKLGDVASGILLPGDPLRAKYIAERYFKNPVQFNNVRGILGFTGEYNGKRVSVMGTGMGIPSMAIYATELMGQYGVESAIRIGTCGSMNPDIHIKDIIFAQGACTDSDFNRQVFPGNYCPVADFELLRAAHKKAEELGIKPWVGNVLSSDTFYQEELLVDRNALWIKYGVMAAEMESAPLFTIAKKFGRRALSILTVSDSTVSKEREMTSQERERSLDDMITIALATLCEFI
ncbi:MAG: purine-nucleoside phosphorylase [Oscillospiraceae bacterium]